MMAEAELTAKTCAKYADEIQAEDIVVLDLEGISSIADYFVICTGTSIPHLKAIRRDIGKKVGDEIGEKPRSVDGNADSHWLVLDYFDVIVHIFHADMREVYSLEDLWSDAPHMDLSFLPERPEPVLKNDE